MSNTLYYFVMLFKNFTIYDDITIRYNINITSFDYVISQSIVTIKILYPVTYRHEFISALFRYFHMYMFLQSRLKTFIDIVKFL